MLEYRGLRAAYMMLVVKRVPDLHKVLTPPKGSYAHAQLTNKQWAMHLAAVDFERYITSYRQPENAFEKRAVTRLLTAFSTPYWELFMPKQQKRQTTWERPEWKGFLERRLTDAELEAFDSETTTAEDILAATTEVIHLGYDIKLSFSSRLGVFTATLVDADNTRKTAGYALSAQDTSGPSALRMLLYKFLVVLEGDLSQLLGGSPTPRRG